MLLATILSESNNVDNCEWYFINFTSDVFIGTLLWYLLMKGIEGFAALNGIDVLNTGIYVHGDYTDITTAPMEPTQQETGHKIDYKIWFLQAVVWNVVVIIVKIWLFFTIQILAPIFEDVAEIILGPLRNHPDLKLVLIMICVPILLNSLQFWIVDNILIAKKENVLKFVNSPFNDFKNTRKLSAKLPLRIHDINMLGHRKGSDDFEHNISEYHS